MGFSTIRILDSAIFRDIIMLIVDDALGGAISNLPLGALPSGSCPPLHTSEGAFKRGSELIYSHCAGTTFFKGFLLTTYCCMWSLEEWRDSCKVCTSAGGGQPKYSICQARGPTRSSLAQMLPLPCLSYYYEGSLITKDQLLSCWPCLRPR